MKIMKKLVFSGALLLTFFLLVLVFTSVVTASGTAPVAENLEISTYRGVSVGGRLNATDPDGGTLTYKLTTNPTKGVLDLSEDGHFVYTPAEGKRGKDYFGYRAIDLDGNCSQEATVIVRIQKQNTKVRYSDTAGNGSEYAAIRLSEEGLYTGEQVAGKYVFSPERPISRQEFLTLCMRASERPPMAAGVSTGFADDNSIDTWARPYVSSALRFGIISGSDTDAGWVFAPEREITAAEAAVILDRCAGLTDAVTAWFSYEDTVPAWALQSVSNISACGLLPYGCSFTDETLSRGAAAEMIVSAMDLLQSRSA